MTFYDLILELVSVKVFLNFRVRVLLFYKSDYATPTAQSYARKNLVLAAVVVSFSGLIIRNIESANSWTIIFYRALAFTFVVCCIILLRHKKNSFSKLKDVGIAGVIAGIILGFTNVTYIIAITNTTVANTLFTVSLIPFITALLAFLFLKEKIRRITFFAMVIAFSGILIMFGGSIAAGESFGNLMALITAFLFSAFTVLIRSRNRIEMLPSLVIGGLISVLVTLLVPQTGFRAPLYDILLCLLLGGVLSGFANTLFTLAARYIFAAEVSFYLFIEFALGPFWVWLFVNEQPTNSTLFGGSVIFVALLMKTLVEREESKRG